MTEWNDDGYSSQSKSGASFYESETMVNDDVGVRLIETIKAVHTDRLTDELKRKKFDRYRLKPSIERIGRHLTSLVLCDDWIEFKWVFYPMQADQRMGLLFTDDVGTVRFSVLHS